MKIWCHAGRRFAGATPVVGSLVHIAHAFRARGWKGFVGQTVLAIVYAFAGLSLLMTPVLGLVTLTLLLIAFLLVSGVVEAAVGSRPGAIQAGNGPWPGACYT